MIFSILLKIVKKIVKPWIACVSNCSEMFVKQEKRGGIIFYLMTLWRKRRLKNYLPSSTSKLYPVVPSSLWYSWWYFNYFIHRLVKCSRIHMKRKRKFMHLLPSLWSFIRVSTSFFLIVVLALIRNIFQNWLIALYVQFQSFIIC